MATLCTLRGVSDPSLVEPEIAAMEVTCRYNIYCISTYLHIHISTYLLSRWRPSWRPPRLSPASPGGRRRPGCWTVAW